MKYAFLVPAALLGLSAVPAAAQDTAPPKPVTVTGSVGLVTDYRLRGVSQTDKEGAIQGGFTITHESGVYVSTWASNLSGWGTFGGSNMELDLIAGYKLPVGGGALDVGLTWYMYPGGASKTDFAEPYVKLSGAAGPVSLLAGVAYAPKQQALGKWYDSAAAYATGTPQRPGKGNDNLYVWGDASAALPDTPLTLKGHIGHSNGNDGLGPNGTSAAPTGEYWDWMLGADLAIKGTPLTLSAAYVDTDISDAKSAYLKPNFASTKDGSSISGATALFSITAAF
ncbi:TorF family putative porin [uncultured Sphingomonas sp.]|uniref:TorF family putative porin n=1 Tax=uncultured Sphingomonas sp. TaxID=158754 RepID=UPI0025834F6E|nr:TorF family putative porin [uncultured Sphingomonas sp.]